MGRGKLCCLESLLDGTTAKGAPEMPEGDAVKRWPTAEVWQAPVRSAAGAHRERAWCESQAGPVADRGALKVEMAVSADRFELLSAAGENYRRRIQAGGAPGG